MKKSSIYATITVVISIGIAIFLLNGSGNPKVEIPKANTGETYDAGFDYEVIKNPVATNNKEGVEIKELFFYLCPHCYNLEPKLNEWKKKTKPKNFVVQPAIFNKNWEKHSDYYYILEELGLVEKLHNDFFNQIHKQKRNFRTKKLFLAWLNEKGVSKEDTDKYKRKYSIKQKTDKSIKQTKEYGITGVPTMIVAGKYRVSEDKAGSKDRLFDIIDYLVRKEQAKK